MKEADRVYVIGQVTERRLGLSVRQVKRLEARYRERGPSGLVSGHRGKRSNNALTESVRREALALVRERYVDFGPTFACEKLVEAHGLRLSAETLRQWMMSDGLWCAKARRAVRVHPSRPRRACFGDLVQIDGSPHDWLEGRAPGCTLIVFIDDAGALGRLRSAGGVLLGPVWCVSGQQEGQGGRVDTVLQVLENTGH